MTKVLLSLHVLAAVIAIGPVAVAASMFPPALRRAAGSADMNANLQVLHRICRVYAAVGLAVPIFGLATGAALGVLGTGWLITSIALTAAAAAILGTMILPDQRAALTTVAAGRVDATAARLAMSAGIFNLLWAIVAVLMVVRPGSTTGV
ncbi:hypothetical protein A5780_20385 [Nocardia sp. 852002-20019_SCH5090214]|uniref:hypothetical protein n=1 Tax=Nocardia TaxID=1817 RepID=UPI0007EAD004|nr:MULTISPECIES: hypothetical protein [Nocardia]OBF87474.1 hypothetical protein A9X06_10785 [Mycobacterium sp. 852002-51759_SCH5129042]MBF6273754.1 hypothetical protein [Nocardia nova]OBA43552.1 hypothetical protein A5789_11710 [Nocardia sp. 852002-51101_SCH5132738]OBA60672.1 hypothetical protein A5780_20385 [Nocardia sp. 852002-20019_SCH5090214]OBB55188.1 hypothetical protein A5748_10455 [Nocardia sp. 852002-51244_SCH5132740]